MAEVKAIPIKVEGIEDIKRLSAALEAYNANRPAMQAQYAEATALYTSATVDAKELRDELARVVGINGAQASALSNAEATAAELRAELDSKRHQLNNATNAAQWAVGVLHGEPVPPRMPGTPISLVESAAQDAARSMFEMRAVIDQLQVHGSMMQHTVDTWRGRCNDLEQQIANAAPRESETKLIEALKTRLAEANDTTARQAAEIDQCAADIAKLTSRASVAENANRELRGALSHSRTIVARRNVEAEELRRAAEQRDEVIKHLHAEYHELEAREQVVQFELDRAQEEIAAAEQYAAKYKPMIEAARAGAVYATFAGWVPLFSWDVTTDGNPDTVAELSGKFYGGSWKCL